MSRVRPVNSAGAERASRPFARWLATVAVCLPALLNVVPAAAQSAENVAVVINEASADSQRIGEYYIRARAIPASHVFRIHADASETISREQYSNTIEGPIALALRRGALHDRILYIVLTKGVPLRIEGSEGLEGTVSSVDSELTLLYRRMTGREVPARGFVANPYYLGTQPIRSAEPFTHRKFDIFLVTRLDAFTVEEAIALVDRARTPSAEGRFVLDQRAALLSNPGGDRWLAEASRRLTELGAGDRVVLEGSTAPARNLDRVLGYYSWGSNDPQNRVRKTQMQFVPGALAATFVSSDARTFRNPPAEWMPSEGGDRAMWFGGSPQSLIGDLIREGATGVAGHVAEPYLQSTVRPEILFPAYMTGLNLAEAFYLAIPHLSWQTVVVGDPLCAAFPRKLLTSADIDVGFDFNVELPSLFAGKRREVAAGAYKGIPSNVVDLLLLAETRFGRGDDAGTKEALGRATKVSPDLAVAQLQLALIEERDGAFESAAARYRAVLRVQPNNAVALNNLAYHVGIRTKTLDEALPYAERAAAIAPRDPSVLDTLGWLEHLRGNSPAAAKHLANAVAIGSGNAEIYLHAAIVFAAVGNPSGAETQLKEALRLNPSLETSDEVRELRARLKRVPGTLSQPFGN